jgi:hypothetical protein
MVQGLKILSLASLIVLGYYSLAIVLAFCFIVNAL